MQGTTRGNLLPPRPRSLTSTPLSEDVRSSPGSSRGSSSGFQSVVYRHQSTGQSYSLRVIKAEPIQTRHKKKIEFKEISQIFVELEEATANVNYILGVVKRKWGPNYIIVTSDGLPIEEGSATKGM